MEMLELVFKYVRRCGLAAGTFAEHAETLQGN
jgi:hypothetical protein